MITMVELSRGITGAFKLARRDPSGLAWFDASPTGYWRSFWAAVVVAPAFLVLDLITGGFGEDAGLRQIMIQIIAYVIDWVAFPLVMIVVADSLDKWPNYMRYIVAYNWSAVVQMSVLLPVAVLAVLFPAPQTMMLAQVVTIILLVYRAYVAHTALGVGFATAGGVVLLDVLLAGVLKALSDRLMAG
ncbi:MAG: hypothetical protein H7Y60_02570 [Rhodospirillaceae bacterium]|nr:hypothetical protein [Rhodospirillales bacterium]